MMEPRGVERDDMRMARICQVIANAHSHKRVFSESEFLFQFKDDTPQSPEEMEKVALQIAKQSNKMRDSNG